MDPMSDETIPDGLVPCALVDLVKCVGTAASEVQPTLASIIQVQLRAVMLAAKQRTLQVTHHWQLVGVPLVSVGQLRHPQLAACHACAASRRNLYHIQGGDGPAEAALVDGLCSDMIERLSEQLDGTGAERARSILRASLHSDGAYVCFECATPILVQRFNARETSGQPNRWPHDVPHNSNSEAFADGQLGRGCTRRRQSSMFIPIDARVLLAQATSGSCSCPATTTASCYV